MFIHATAGAVIFCFVLFIVVVTVSLGLPKALRTSSFDTEVVKLIGLSVLMIL